MANISVRFYRALRVVGVSGVLATIMAGVYGFIASEAVIGRTYNTPLVELVIPDDSLSIKEGYRLARITGCFGCHGESPEGAVFVDDFRTGRVVAPNLTRVAQEYSVAELARAIRYGVRRNGEGVQIMPSPMYYHLSDAALGTIIAYLRAAPRVEGLDYEFSPGPVTRWEIARGRWLPWPEDILQMGERMPPPDSTNIAGYGEYLARTTCTECHGNDLEGGAGGGPPDLRIAAAYSLHEFTGLMRTGLGLGQRDLQLMSRVARGRFSHFTDFEINALHTFFRSRAIGNGGS
jgi:cytochrome c553